MQFYKHFTSSSPVSTTQVHHRFLQHKHIHKQKNPTRPVIVDTWKNKDHSPLSTYQNTKIRTGDCLSILFFIAIFPLTSCWYWASWYISFVRNFSCTEPSVVYSSIFLSIFLTLCLHPPQWILTLSERVWKPDGKNEVTVGIFGFRLVQKLNKRSN